MEKKVVKRCEYCGGTMWRDGDVVKCFMCSRPEKSQEGDLNFPSRSGEPRIPGTSGRSGYRRDR